MSSTLSAGLEQAARHIVAQQYDQARTVLGTVLAAQPDHAGALLQASYLASLEGHYRQARDYTLRAARAPRPTEEDVAELLARLRTFNEAGELLGLLERLGPPARLSIPLLLTAAAQLSYLNLQERALVYLDEAHRADPDYPPTLVSRAQVLTYLGRFGEAEANLRHCLRRAPHLASAWWALSRLPRQADAISHDIIAMRQSLARPGLKADDAALLMFALHTDLDRAGEYAEAGQALIAGCRAKRSTLRYSPEAFEAMIDLLVTHTTPWSPSPPEGHPGPVPVFIVGMHRSGTTLLEQLLAQHGDVFGIGELYDFTSQMRQATDHHCRGVIDAELIRRAASPGIDFTAVGRGYLDGIRWRIGQASHFTDKLPTNFLHLGYIARALPHARILHMRRDPRETCFSNLRELFSDANPHSYDPGELAHYHAQYQRLMAHWHQVLPGRILDVDYQALTTETEMTMRTVANFCDLAFDPAQASNEGARSVATASAVQVRGRIRPSSDKWRPYEKLLSPWFETLLTT